ncbi:MAG: ABC-type transport auxiliary lipoprotein family protein [Salinisphaera sp.]|nr:ABC-type transport auxiliary lipoprotein family protein [Salinisphaera sp.]
MNPIRPILYLVVTVLLVGGCATTAKTRNLFLLDQSGGTDSVTPRGKPSDSPLPTFTLSRVTLAPYLAHRGIVYQTGPNRIAIADNNRWAAALEHQITVGLYDALERGLANVTVRRAANGVAQADLELTLTVHLKTFQGRYDGNAVISGAWRLFDEKGQLISRGEFSRETPLQEDGYPALVRALSQGWRFVKRSLVEELGKALNL